MVKSIKFWSLVFATIVVSTSSCSNDRELKANAFRVENRTQLIGGKTALGEVGDYMLVNDKIRVVIQDKTFNRGSGVFGGSLIDADLVRPTNQGSQIGGNGNDSFGEMFPAFFLEMIDPDSVEVVNDGSDGKAAIVEVKGRGGEFVTMLRYLNQLLVNSYKEPSELVQELFDNQPPSSDGDPNIEFSSRYILEPGARHIRIESTMTNVALRDLELPPEQILVALKTVAGIDLGTFRLPLGHVLGFGATSSVFIPGIGFDIRQGLLDALSVPVELPGFPGALTPMVGSKNTNGVNYGFAYEDAPENNFVVQRDQETQTYGNRSNPGDMLYLFNASGFGGVFSSQAPTRMSPSFCGDGSGDPQSVCETFIGTCNDEVCGAKITNCVNAWDSCVESVAEVASSFTYTNYFILGDGDVASLWEELYKIRGLETFAVRGQVRDEVTNAPVDPNTSVLIYESDGGCDDAKILSQAYTVDGGRFELALPDGSYCYQINGSNRPNSKRASFKVSGKPPQFINATAPSNGTIVGLAVDETGGRSPFKMTAVGTHDLFVGQTSREFLVDLAAGDPWRPTDVIPDTDDPNTRKYIEEMAYSNGPGEARLHVRPGKYEIYFSRGMEFDVDIVEVEVKSGATVNVQGTLKRAVDTTGYLNGDFHLHSAGSIDSGLDNNIRVKSLAGEGVEIAVSTEHNYVTDYEPYILRNDLVEFMNSTIGLELTTFEAGHFNAFPVDFQIDKVSRGSIRWQEIPPNRIFAELRDLGNGENVIQVNHPRTPILGYFAQHNVDAFDTNVVLPINAENAELTDVIAAPNGSAFFEETVGPDNKPAYTSTFSWDFDAIEVFNGPHLEELRHFRMPFDKTANASEPDALPPEVLESFRATTLEPFAEDEPGLNAELAAFSDQTTEEIEALSATARQDLVDEFVQSKIPPQYDIICDGNAPAHPGVLDDFYNLLNYNRPDGEYRVYTATGNSDSHKARIDDPGYPRNFFWTGNDDPRAYTDSDLKKAIDSRRNIISNGPFVEFTVNDEPIGSELSATGQVTIDVKIQAANWVGAERFRIVRNGEAVMGLDPDQDTEFWGWIPVDIADGGTFEASYSVPVDRDSWFVVEVEGDKSLFPIISPQDIAPFNFADVIGSLAGAFGLGGGIEGLEPNFVFAVTSFAFTNPIWVIADGDGTFTAPNPPTLKCEDGLIATNASVVFDPETLRVMNQGRLRATKIPHIQKPKALKRPTGEHRDVRMLFEALGGHQH